MIDISVLNIYLLVLTFKMETAEIINTKGEGLIPTDLTYVYHNQLHIIKQNLIFMKNVVSGEGIEMESNK